MPPQATNILWSTRGQIRSILQERQHSALRAPSCSLTHASCAASRALGLSRSSIGSTWRTCPAIASAPPLPRRWRSPSRSIASVIRTTPWRRGRLLATRAAISSSGGSGVGGGGAARSCVSSAGCSCFALAGRSRHHKRRLGAAAPRATPGRAAEPRRAARRHAAADVGAVDVRYPQLADEPLAGSRRAVVHGRRGELDARTTGAARNPMD